MQRALSQLADNIEAQNAGASVDYGSTTPGMALPPNGSTLSPTGFAIPSKPLVNLIPAPVINADRTTDASAPASASAPAALTLNLNGAQQLPAVNTTATVIDWKKYLPWIIAVVVLILLVAAMRRKS